LESKAKFIFRRRRRRRKKERKRRKDSVENHDICILYINIADGVTCVLTPHCIIHLLAVDGLPTCLFANRCWLSVIFSTEPGKFIIIMVC